MNLSRFAIRYPGDHYLWCLKLQFMKNDISVRKPQWLKSRLPSGKSYATVKQIVASHHLHTICSSGNCPNMGECWGMGTATLMILGDICTRSCKFCGVKTGKPLPPDPDEPMNVARSVELMKLKHVVITSVDRDDLPDKGASHWVNTIEAIRKINPGTTIEALIPDFDAMPHLLDRIIEIHPEVVSHNLETVRRLTPEVRSRAKYDTSLTVLRYLSEQGINTKSGIMAGLGETEDEVLETMEDLIGTGCRIFTIGQYLQPSAEHLPVAEFIRPEVFERYRDAGLRKGFRHVESSPLVRSSYHAEKHVH